MSGPLTQVGTIVSGISLDVSRLLYAGSNKTLDFVIPDKNETDGYQILKTIDKGFDKLSFDEELSNDSSEIIFRIADPDGTIKSLLDVPKLMLRFENVMYVASRVPYVAFNEPQVFDIVTRIRIFRSNFEGP